MRKYNKGMNELRQKRKELGLTQLQAANACGVSRRTYQTYEEKQLMNATFEDLRKKLDEMGALDGSNYICNINFIKRACKEVFSSMYPEVKAAYLFGSYARGEATGKSDIDILVVCSPMDMKFFGMVSILEERLHKTVDISTHRQLLNSEPFLRQVLKDGMKIYG